MDGTVDGVGLIIKKNCNGRFNLYVVLSDGNEILSFAEFDCDRAKGAIMRQAQLALVEISQNLTRGGYDLTEDPAI